MEDNAKAYDQLNKPQYEAGCKFISEFINLSPGDKVLDMGCGTGHITKYVADIVGPDGQVVGIDPDAARIKIAEEKYKEVSHLQFHVGSSVTGFPHDNEPYYDVHLSTAAFHWLSNEEKPIYIQKAYDCLKPGGRLAILCVEMPLDINPKTPVPVGFCPLTQDGYHKVFQDLGLFRNVVVNSTLYPSRFETLEVLKQWYKTSSHHDFEDLDPTDASKYLIHEDDGGVTWKIPRVAIIASKN
jgi:ubiquinone/menaquinone biosynthesis C-methylase UbiE